MADHYETLGVSAATQSDSDTGLRPYSSAAAEILDLTWKSPDER